MGEGDKDKSQTKPSAKPEAYEYENPNHPLYLHHSDQPGIVLVTELLNSDNYATWSLAMMMALSAKNKEGIVDGSILKPSINSTTESQQWVRCNNLVKSWLLNSISQDIRASVIYIELAYEIWNDLKERFSSVNNVHLYHIEEAIHECTQNNMGIGAYYTKLKGLWDERDALCAIPTCKCGTMKEVLHFRESQKTMKFIMGLNESYAAVRGQILLMDPLPTVNKAHSLIMQDEKQRTVSSSKRVIQEVNAFAVTENTRNSSRKFTPRNPHLKCDRCDKIGHTSETCRSHLKCDYCGWRGHTMENCRKLRGKNGGDESQEKRSFSSKINHVESRDKAVSQSNPISLTSEQYQNLLTLLGNNNSTHMANFVGGSSTANNLSGPTFGEDDWDEN